MRRSIFALLVTIAAASPAFALSGAAPDGEDRFPFVVEINYDGQLICSGTVLYPRIVVTAAHCMQEKLAWRGAQIFADQYLEAAQLTVSVTRRSKTEIHAVAEVTVSPAWQSAAVNAGAAERFAHDIALIITKEPIDVGLPPSFGKLADAGSAEPQSASCPTGNAQKSAAEMPAENGALRDALLKRVSHHGVLVAFGAESCTPRYCAEAGVRRYQSVAIRESADCFMDNRGRPRSPPLPAAFTANLPLAVWCMESSVLPGDSGGALLVEGPMGELYYLGVISAQQGRYIALADSVLQKRSLATALYPNLDFILEQARKLGY